MTGITGQIAPGYQQFCDANGHPLAGGEVYHYLPNTSTQVTTYVDPGFTTPNTWPVRLDAAGRARIYYNSSVRQVVKDRNGVQIWDTTTVTSFSSSSSAAVTLETIADLRANTSPYPIFYLLGYHDPGDGGGGHFLYDSGDTTSVDNGGTVIVDAGGRRYKRPETGAMPTNARWFGLMGDGDDASTIGQTMINLGFDVYFPIGTYTSTNQWTLSTTGQTIKGDGWTSSILQFSGNYNCLLYNGPTDIPSSDDQGMGLEDIMLSCANMTGGYAVEVKGADRFICSRVLFFLPNNGVKVHGGVNYALFDTLYGAGPRGTVFFDFSATTTTRSDVIKVHKTNVGGSSKTWHGINIDGPVSTIHLNEVGFVLPKKGILCVNTTGSAEHRPNFLIIYDLEVDFPLEQSINIENLGGFWAHTIYAHGSTNTEGMSFGDDVTSVKISQGYIRGNKKEGMVSGAHDVAITATQFVFNSFPDYTLYDAVRLTGTAERHQFTSCAFGGLEGVGSVARYGCSIENGATAIRFAACDFYGCIFGDVLDNSGSTTPGNIQKVASNAQEFLGSENLIGWDINTRAGVGAKASVSILSGVITSVTVTDQGSQYGNGTWRGGAPTVVAYDPSGAGSGAVLVPTVDAATGRITAIAVSVGGANYGPNTAIRILPAARTPTLRVTWPSLTNVNGMVQAKGIGSVVLANDSGISAIAGAEAAAVNYIRLQGRASGSYPYVAAVGDDTDIDLQLFSKGAGNIHFVTVAVSGSAGGIVNYATIKVNGAPYKIALYALS